MQLGMVGLPGSGKTTLFNALTGSRAEGFGEKVNIGVANIPDPRLYTIAQFITTKEIVHATIRLVDIPGVPPGSDARKLNSLLEQIRLVDGICHVVRCFDDGSGTIDPARDVESMRTELILADLVVAEGARDRATRTARSGEKDAKARVELLGRICAALESETPIRAMEGLSEADHALMKSYGFITAKPVLFVANVAESDLSRDSPYVAAVRASAEKDGSESIQLCAKLEAEIAELADSDRAEMLESLGLSEPAVGPLARAANRVLGLTTFYTAGEKAVRAWSTKLGATAPEAAGAIHTDLQRGFIRAECYAVDELVQHKSEKAIREAGRLRSEGRNYRIADGDVIYFLFNV